VLYSEVISGGDLVLGNLPLGLSLVVSGVIRDTMDGKDTTLVDTKLTGGITLRSVGLNSSMI
jgi:hypothetical protein